jgi:GrpB-like predicted nucleotidyltransferase (UPF0157 family)
MTAPIIIEEYDPRWPERFITLRTQIAAALCPLVAAIEHVGSTAVPGMAAKPIIDIDVLLRSEDDLPLAIKALSALGYRHEGNLGVAGREAFRTPSTLFPHHLYAYPSDAGEFRRHLAFRDHLRAHPEDASAYALLKRQLATRFGSERDAYTRGKSDFIGGILRRASAI